MARDFSTVGDRVAWTGGPILYNQTSASILFWFKHGSQSLATNDFVFDIQNAFNIRIFVILKGITATAHKIGVTWRCDGNAGGNAAFDSTTSWDDGLWHRMLIVRRNASPFVELYVDGVSDGSSTTDPVTSPSTPVGQCWANNVQGAFNAQFSGSLARCAFLSGTALTPQEADSFLYSGVSSRTLDQWFEMGVGLPEPDWSGNGLAGTVTGSTVTADPPFTLPWMRSVNRIRPAIFKP